MLDPDVAARSFFCRADVIINNVLVPTNSAANQVFTVLPRYQAIFYPEDAKDRKQHFKVLSEWDVAQNTDLMNEASKFFAHSAWNDTQYIRVHVPLDGIFPFDTKAAVHQAIEGAKPQVLFLDEPTVGLDPLARSYVWTLVKQLRERYGTTIILTTHFLEEADSLCDRVAIMQAGKVVITGVPSELKASLNHEKATLDDVFIHYTGDQLTTGGGDYRETSRNRRTAQRLG